MRILGLKITIVVDHNGEFILNIVALSGHLTLWHSNDLVSYIVGTITISCNGFLLIPTTIIGI